METMKKFGLDSLGENLNPVSDVSSSEKDGSQSKDSPKKVGKFNRKYLLLIFKKKFIGL